MAGRTVADEAALGVEVYGCMLGLSDLQRPETRDLLGADWHPTRDAILARLAELTEQPPASAGSRPASRGASPPHGAPPTTRARPQH